VLYNVCIVAVLVVYRRKENGVKGALLVGPRCMLTGSVYQWVQSTR